MGKPALRLPWIVLPASQLLPHLRQVQEAGIAVLHVLVPLVQHMERAQEVRRAPEGCLVVGIAAHSRRITRGSSCHQKGVHAMLGGNVSAEGMDVLGSIPLWHHPSGPSTSRLDQPSCLNCSHASPSRAHSRVGACLQDARRLIVIAPAPQRRQHHRTAQHASCRQRIPAGMQAERAAG